MSYNYLHPFFSPTIIYEMFKGYNTFNSRKHSPAFPLPSLPICHIHRVTCLETANININIIFIYINFSLLKSITRFSNCYDKKYLYIYVCMYTYICIYVYWIEECEEVLFSFVTDFAMKCIIENEIVCKYP